MKIGQTPELPGGLPPTGLAKQAKAPASAAEGATKDALVASSAGVPVTVSTAARALSPATRSTADFDAGKVKAVRAAIEKANARGNTAKAAEAQAELDRRLVEVAEFKARLAEI